MSSRSTLLIHVLASLCWLPFATAQNDSLSGLEIQEVQRMLHFSEDSYRDQNPAPGSLPKNVEFVHRFSDGWLDFTVYKHVTPSGQVEHILSFAGTEDLNDAISDVVQGAPNIPSRRVERQLDFALRTARKYLETVDRDANAKLVVTGHSYGGAVAQYVAIKLGLRAVVFNSAALGESTIRDIAPQLLEAAGRNILHIVHQRDPVFELTARIPRARQFGTVIEIIPAPGTTGILHNASFLNAKPSIVDRFKDLLTRHDIHALKMSFEYQAAYGELRLMSVAEALDKSHARNTPVLWASPSTVPRGSSLRDQMNFLLDSTSEARRVVVVGKGPDVDWLQRQLVERLGVQNVQRDFEVRSADNLRSSSASFRPDAILGLRSQAFGQDSGGDVVMGVDTAKRVANALFSSAEAVHALARHGAPVNKFVGDPEMRRRAEAIDKVLGPSQLSLFTRELIGVYNWSQKAFDWGDALLQDCEKHSTGGLTLQNSKAFEQAVDVLLDEGLGKLRDTLVEKGVLTRGPTFGTDELAKAAFRHLRDGHATIDTIDRYADAVVGASFGALGMVASGGNVRVAQAFESAGVALAQAGRAGTEDAFKRLVLKSGGTVDEMLGQWQTEQISYAWRGLQQEAFLPWLESRGVDSRCVSPAMKLAADDAFTSSQRLAVARHPETTEIFNIAPADPSSGASRSTPDLEVAGRVIASSQRRVVINGGGRQGEALYQMSVSALGDGSVLWIRKKTSHYSVVRQAREFGASRVFQVDSKPLQIQRYDSRREIIASGAQAGGTRQAGALPTIPFEEKPPRREPRRPDVEPIDLPMLWDAFQPPPPPPGAASSPSIARRAPEQFHGPDIGGVMLRGAASVGGDAEKLVQGDFSLLIGGAHGEVDIRRLRMFVTAAWAVYFGTEGPGLSIDPIAPAVDKHVVRYIGLVTNSDLGRVMREADYLMKQWAVGTSSPGIPGFKCVDRLEHEHGAGDLGASRRFWFVPEDMRFEVKGGVLVFEGGHMRLKTEYVNSSANGKSEKADREFARYFTENYIEISTKHPVFAELFEYAKLVCLAQYLRDEGIPMAAYLLANKDMLLVENSPSTVMALVKPSEYREHIKVVGGVNLKPQRIPANDVVNNDSNSGSAHEIFMSGRVERLPSEAHFSSDDKPGFSETREPATVTNSAKTGDSGESMSVGIGASGQGSFHTDLALRIDGDPALELVRMRNSNPSAHDDFGPGWKVLCPYRIEPCGDTKMKFRNVEIPSQVTLTDLITHHSQVLTFDEQRYAAVGYLPAQGEGTTVVGVFIMSDCSFCLLDCIGSEFHFAPDGDLDWMAIGKKFRIAYERDYESVAPTTSQQLAARMEPLGSSTVVIGRIKLPERIRFVNPASDQDSVFTIIQDDPKGRICYAPDDPDIAVPDSISLMTDGSFLASSKRGLELLFDSAGHLKVSRQKVLRALTHGDRRVEFEYQYQDGGFRIVCASVRKVGAEDPVCKIKYRYEEGRLVEATRPDGSRQGIETPLPASLRTY